MLMLESSKREERTSAKDRAGIEKKRARTGQIKRIRPAKMKDERYPKYLIPALHMGF